MNPERLAKFSKEELITFHLRQAERIEYLEERVKNTQYVGRISIDGKFYCLYVKEEK